MHGICSIQSYLFWPGDCKTRNEMRRDKIKQKRKETQQKPNKSSINIKKTKQTLTKRFFLHETTIHKMSVADWKTFIIYGKIWLWKTKIIRISYKKAHPFPASCVLCTLLRFIEKKKYIIQIYLIDIKSTLQEATVNNVTPWSSIRWKPTPWSDRRVAHDTTQFIPLDIYLWS